MRLKLVTGPMGELLLVHNKDRKMFACPTSNSTSISNILRMQYVSVVNQSRGSISYPVWLRDNCNMPLTLKASIQRLHNLSSFSKLILKSPKIITTLSLKLLEAKLARIILTSEKGIGEVYNNTAIQTSIGEVRTNITSTQIHSTSSCSRSKRL